MTLRFPPIAAVASAAVASAAVVGAAALVPAARADVAIVQKVTVSGIPKEMVEAAAPGAPDPTKPQTIKTFVKGDRVRTETGPAITIFDAAAEQLYVLNPANKQYTVMPIKHLLESTAGNPMMAMLKFDTVADLKETADTKAIGGKPARKYAYTATIKMGLQGNEQMSSLLPTVTLEGEQWVSEGLAAPAAYQRMNAVTGLGAIREMLGKGAAPLIDKLGSLKGFPVASRDTTTFKFSDPNSPLAAQVPKEPLVKTTELVSVDEKDLDAALFQIPADYKKVEAPAPSAPAPAPAAPSAKP